MSNLNATATPGYTFSTAKTNGAANSGPNAYLYPHHTSAVAESLVKTAHALVNPKGKGIYATDETPEGIHARLLAAHGEEGKGKTFTEDEWKEKRRRWRECLYESLPTGMSIHNDSQIMFD